MIAWRSLFAIRKLLCDNKVALRHRLRLLSSCVSLSLCWCSGSWISDSQSQCTHLRAIQDKMLRRMMYVPWCSTETPEVHMIRWSKLLHNCRRKYKILHGDEMYFASYFSWCGHVARLTKADPQRETSRILMLKNVEWLAEFEERARIPMSWTPLQGCGDGSRPLRSVLAQIGHMWHRVGWGGGPRWMR